MNQTVFCEEIDCFNKSVAMAQDDSHWYCMEHLEGKTVNPNCKAIVAKRNI